MDEPLVHGPNQEGFPFCLSCCDLISLDYLCPSCSYPMCDAECANDPLHAEECAVLSRCSKPVFENGETEGYHCILPLRLGFLARNDPDRFNLADHLMDHEEERRGGKDWNTTERTVVQNLMQNCDRTEAEIRRAVGVLEVNSYEITPGLRACFPIASLLSHSCVANSRHIWSQTPPYTNTCIAAIDLDCGQEVLTTYQVPTTCSLRRRPNLREGWYFDCKCDRCSSLNELDTNINTLMCKECKQPTLLPENTLQYGSIWRCQCGYEVSENTVRASVDNIITQTRNLIENERDNVEKWLKLEETIRKLVHPQHETMLEVAKWLIPILCRAPNKTTAEYPLNLVSRKLDLAQNYLNVLNVVEPGYSKSRVKALYEVVETELFLMFQDNVKVEFRKEILETYKLKLQIVIKVLERLGTNRGFETVIVQASENLLRRLTDIQSYIEDHNTLLDEWREGWSLMELWSMNGC